MTPRVPDPSGLPPGSSTADPGIPIADPDAAARSLLAAGKARAAAEEVVRVHGPRVRQYLRSVLRDPDTSDDAYSLWSEWTVTAIDRFRNESSLQTWAFGVAHNAVRRIRADAFGRRRCSLRRGGISRAAAPRVSSSARRVERAAALLDAIRRGLSAEEQELLALRIDQGLAWEQVATVLAGEGEPVTGFTLRKRFERLKDRIQHLASVMGGLE